MKNAKEWERAFINAEAARFQGEVALITAQYYCTDMSDETYTELLNQSARTHGQIMKDYRDYIIPNMKRDVFREG